VTAAVDTGLLDRRRSIMGARARRRRTVVLAVLAGLATVGGGYWALTGPPVAIRHLTLSGYARKDRGALDWAARVAASSGTMVSLPTGRIREALAAFPWVGRVDVRRDWPWGIVVDVHQARAAAVVVPSRGQRMLVSASGRVLGPAPARPGLPRIRMDGPPPAVGGSLTSAAVRAPLAFLAPLPREIARRVRRLGFDENGLLGARLQGGPELRLGAPELLHEKARALVAIMRYLPVSEASSVSYLDLTVPQNAAAGLTGTLAAQLSTASPELVPTTTVSAAEPSSHG
jgi:cell division septal protein FtsQ